MYRLIALALLVSTLLASPPAWFSRQESSTSYIVGVGSGATLKEAKQAALEDISTQLSVGVKSSFASHKESDMRLSDGKRTLSKTSLASHDLALLSENKLAFVSYEKKAHSGGLYYILARLDKLAFSDYLKEGMARALSKVATPLCPPYLSLSEARADMAIYARASANFGMLGLLGAPHSSAIEAAYRALQKSLSDNGFHASMQLRLELSSLSKKDKAIVKKASYSVAKDLLHLDKSSPYTLLVHASMDGKSLILELSYTDCKGEERYSDSIILDAKDIYANRINGLMYKSLDAYISSQSEGSSERDSADMLP